MESVDTAPASADKWSGKIKQENDSGSGGGAGGSAGGSAAGGGNAGAGGKGSGDDAGPEVSMTSGSVVEELALTDHRICPFFVEMSKKEGGSMKHVFDAFDVDNLNNRVACPYVNRLHYKCAVYKLTRVSAQCGFACVYACACVFCVVLCCMF